MLNGHARQKSLTPAFALSHTYTMVDEALSALQWARLIGGQPRAVGGLARTWARAKRWLRVSLVMMYLLLS